MQTPRVALASIAAAAVAAAGLTGLWHLRDNSAAELNRLRTSSPAGLHEVDCASMHAQLNPSLDPTAPMQRCFETTKASAEADFHALLAWAQDQGYSNVREPVFYPDKPVALAALRASDAGVIVDVIPPDFFTWFSGGSARPDNLRVYIELTGLSRDEVETHPAGAFATDPKPQG